MSMNLPFRLNFLLWHFACVFAVAVSICLNATAYAQLREVESAPSQEKMEGLMQQAQQHYENGELGTAIETMQRLLTMQRRVAGGASVDTAQLLVMLSDLQRQNEDFAGAETSATEALQIIEPALGKNDWRTAETRLHLKDVQIYRELTPKQRESLKQAEELRQKQRKFEEAGDYLKAIDFGKKALEIERSILGLEHPQTAETMGSLSLSYSTIHDFQAAKPFAREALRIRELLFGDEHPEYADSLVAWATLATSRGDYQDAIKSLEKALEVYQQSFGEADLKVLQTLDDLAKNNASMGRFDEAVAHYDRALNIAERAVGKMAPAYQLMLNNLATVYSDQGHYQKAELVYKESLALIVQSQGKQSSSYTYCSNNLASHYQTMGAHQKARKLYEELLYLQEQAGGKSHPAYALTLSDLASLCSLEGDFEQAEALLRQALELFESRIGVQHPTYATCLGRLADLRLAQADFVDAGRLFQKALEVHKQSSGEGSLEYARSLNNLASFYSSMGDEAKAVGLYRQSNTIVRKIHGDEHPDSAISASNLALSLASMGETEKADATLQHALSVFKVNFGESHPKYIQALVSLGRLCLDAGKYEQAKTHLQHAHDLVLEVFGDENHEYLNVIRELAKLAFWTGDFETGQRLLRQAIETSTTISGEQHPQTFGLQSDLATLFYARKDFARAERLFRDSLHAARAGLDTAAMIQSERQQLAMAANIRVQLDTYLAMVVDAEQYQTRAFREVLRWKGATSVRQQQMRTVADDKELAPLFKKLQQTATRLASLSRIFPEPENQDSWKRQITELTAEKERLEAELSRQNATFRNAQDPVTLEDLLTAFPPDATLVDFVEYSRPNPDEVTNKDHRWVRSLVAFVIRKDQPIALFDLGPTAPVVKAIDTWRQSFGTSRDGIAAGQSLRKAIWQPLEKHLEETELVLVSVDGVLGRLPLQALPGKKPNTYLVEDHRLAFIPVPQLLPSLVAGQPPEPAANSLFVMGDVNYDADSNQAEKIASNSLSTAMVRGSDTYFSNLPGTVGEIATIQSVFSQQADASSADVMSLGQDEATEQAFREAASQYRTLHLATHGFFAAADKQSALASDAKRTGAQSVASERDQILRGFNPGLLSGLAFSGANRKPELDQDDGILTADEIAALRLDHVDLVVLSACETGLGEVAGGEGLLGVQRSFQVAGARSTVASLWQVGDVATKLLMERFYRNLWEKKMSKLDALREAQLHLLNHPEEVLGNEAFRGDRRVRPTKNKTQPNRLSPQFWAAFSLSGDWR
ncbi:photosystem I assembly protein Ycf3 [Rosistilla ulvae]|uniref:Photosystem I assembly protein Ycf3 n=1 Tax=Rosistilla ulvae TaxID=1930277 RepID=A0A517M8N9_9BACT|nr:CHAT domain-containing protein [Rosistilla ulvae]QDS91234.1 photosystem I assembly protein Ycf3 [Rosistilla ulvae]